jgi:3-deoxy-D-manno-octulosonate 8-phosphate phosphatase (KDO 8-P phosphatase)
LHRIAELNISRFWVNQSSKLEAINIIIQEDVIKPNQILYVGDDIPDLEVIENVGLFVAVQDAHEMVKEKAHWITNASGGQGAVREVCDLVQYSIENNYYD